MRMYVTLTAVMKVAGIAVQRLASLCACVFNKYAVATQRAIIARVWLLQEK